MKKAFEAILCATAVSMIAAGILVGTGKSREYREAEETYESLNQYMPVKETAGPPNLPGADPETTGMEKKTEDPAAGIDFDSLEEINPDFAGVLYIPVLGLKYPIARSKDNSEYMHTTYDGTQNSAGSIFLDCNCSPQYNDLNTFLFGHNMRDGSMFGSLKKFRQDASLVDQDPSVYIFLSDKTIRYRIFAYYTTQIGSSTYDSFVGEDAYRQYIAYLEKKSLYHTDEVDLSGCHPILTLSTCTSRVKDERFVVHAVRE